MKTVVVLSGGMDSATALAFHLSRGEQCHALSFHYGAKHNARENHCAKLLSDHYGVPWKLVTMPFIDELFTSDLLKSGGEIPEGHYEAKSMTRTVVPMRNGIMLAIAAGYAQSIGAWNLVIGNHAGDHAIYPDCRKEFMIPMAEAIKAATGNVELVRPFERMTKAQIVTKGLELKVPYELTWSCYKGEEQHCGKCGTCVERVLAFHETRSIDPVIYRDGNYAFHVKPE